mgnify:FL=1
MKHAKKLIILILVISIVINLELRFVTDDNYVLLNLKVDNEAFTSLQFEITPDGADRNAQRLGMSKGEIILIALMMNNYSVNDDILDKLDKRVCVRNRNRLMHFNGEEFAFYTNVIDSLIIDMEYFPVARSKTRKTWVEYEDSWGNERTYGGERTHEGCDIMSEENKRGVMPVIAASGGTVTNLGWLELGGWRIGITSDNGIYYYYAHLDSYADNMAEGTKIRKGQLIGYMGDSGYSKVEGTVGKFDVHLHFGIYIYVDGKETALNPYYLLKNISNKILYYQY